MPFRWEAARDWKETNPKGTMQDFNNFWDSIQQEKDKVQVGCIHSALRDFLILTLARYIKTEQSNLYMLIYLTFVILIICFQNTTNLAK